MKPIICLGPERIKHITVPLTFPFQTKLHIPVVGICVKEKLYLSKNPWSEILQGPLSIVIAYTREKKTGHNRSCQEQWKKVFFSPKKSLVQFPKVIENQVPIGRCEAKKKANFAFIGSRWAPFNNIFCKFIWTLIKCKSVSFQKKIVEQAIRLFCRWLQIICRKTSNFWFKYVLWYI